MAAGSSAAAVRQKQQDLSNQYKAHRQAVTQLQSKAIEDLLPSLAEQEDWDDDAQERAKSFLEDEATIFRFFRRSRFDENAALALISTTLKWRVRTDLDMLSVSSLHPLYTSPPQGRPPLLWLGSKFIDRFGRPCGLISLQSLERTQDRTLDECKEYIVACMEIVRRRIVELRRKFQREGGASQSADETTQASQGPLQLVIAFDLLSSSMSNLELELLPFLLDLLKNHFPGMVGAVFVLHYGWVHAGMWGIAKRILPAQALAKIFFPNDAEFTEHFEPSKIPSELGVGGGTWQVSIDENSNDIMTRLGRPNLQPGRAGGSAPSSPTGTNATNSPVLTRKGHMSRGGSFESLADTYFSAAGTPRTGASRAMTPRGSEPSTPRGGGSGSSLEMTPSAAKKLRMLQMTRGNSDTVTPTMSSRAAHRSARQQHIGIQQPQQQQDKGAGSSSTAQQPIRRNRSLRDFSLVDDGHEAGEATTANDSDVESDKSGKTGEVNVDVRQDGSGRLGRLLSLPRWRSQRQSTAQESDADRRKYSQDLAAQQSTQQQERAELASPQLQVPDDVLPSEPPLSVSFSKSLDPNRPPRFLSRRSRKLEKVPGAVSPYNASNPFWGYPAWIVQGDQSDDDDENDDDMTTTTQVEGSSSRRKKLRRMSSNHHTGGRPIQMTVRRRWRDLFRTLSYLFVLRILSAHRNLRWKLNLLLSRLSGLISSSPPSRGTVEALHGYDERTERHRRLRAASNRFRGGQRTVTNKKDRATPRRGWWSTQNLSIAAVVFALVLILRLRSRRGFIRDLLSDARARAMMAKV